MAIALTVAIAVPTVISEATANPTLEIAQAPDLDRIFNQGVAQLQRRDFEAAIASFSQVLEEKADDPMAYIGRAFAYRNQGDYRKAIEDYNATLRLQPDNPKAYLDRGICYYHLEEYEQAEENYSTALRYNEKYGQAYYNRGLARLNLDKHRTALADFRQAAAIYQEQELEEYYQEALERIEDIQNGGTGTR